MRKNYTYIKNYFIFALETTNFEAMTVNIYEQYFAASLIANEVPRRAALVMLISDSEAGYIQYVAQVTFFPHRFENDFAVSYDACFGKVIYEAKGRRSKKREQALLEGFRSHIDQLAEEAGGEVFWDQPLREARREV